MHGVCMLLRKTFSTRSHVADAIELSLFSFLSRLLFGLFCLPFIFFLIFVFCCISTYSLLMFNPFTVFFTFLQHVIPCFISGTSITGPRLNLWEMRDMLKYGFHIWTNMFLFQGPRKLEATRERGSGYSVIFKRFGMSLARWSASRGVFSHTL